MVIAPLLIARRRRMFYLITVARVNVQKMISHV